MSKQIEGNNLKRDLIKYVRDKAKARYDKSTCCYICGEEENLDFHHYSSLTTLFDKYMLENGLEIRSVEDIVSIREEFIAVHHKELYDDAVTLCKTHHQRLHSIYGAKPPLATAPKQERWVEIQREKRLAKI